MEEQAPTGLRLAPVTGENRPAVLALELFPQQAGFIESVEECLQEARRLSLWRPVGIYDGSVLVGFAMYGFFPRPEPGQLWLDRLLIDRRHQGKGYGRRAVAALLERLRREYPVKEVYLSVYETNLHAISLYQKMGFRFNGALDEKGERIMTRPLFEEPAEEKPLGPPFQTTPDVL